MQKKSVKVGRHEELSQYSYKFVSEEKQGTWLYEQGWHEIFFL